MSKTTLDRYHDDIADYLKAQCPWLQEVTDYPEKETELEVPCAFFEIAGWDQADDGAALGDHTIVLDAQIVLVFGFAAELAQRDVRNAALNVTAAIDESRMGMSYDPAQFVSAQPYAFDPALDQYATWEVRFTHKIELGETDFDDLSTGLTPTKVLVSRAPAIGIGHEADYENILEQDDE